MERVKIVEGKRQIYDELRKKYVPCTPEEEVRQHFIQYLVKQRGYPRSLLRAESGIQHNKLSKRYDLLGYNRQGEPFLLVECKAPGVKISQKVFNQVAVYNQEIQAKHLVVTNGNQTYCCSINLNEGKYQFLEAIPNLPET